MYQQYRNKKPCEDAAKVCQSVIIYSETSPKLTWTERTFKQKEDITAKETRDRSQFVNRDKDLMFWRSILWSDENKVELFGYNDQCCIWKKKKKVCKTENTIPTVK